MSDTRILIAYFSRKGNNYVDGRIVDLPVGNTEVAAGLVHDLTGGDLFRIDPVEPYPADYQAATEVARQELERGARPDLAGHVDDLAAYDTVILAYPNWWGTLPMAVWTFLEAHDLSGKTLLPLCTHEGSGMGRSERDLERLCPGSRLLKGLPIQGGRVRNAGGAIGAWLRQAALAG